MKKKMASKKGRLYNTFLTFVEKGGNWLPHPASLFAIFAFLVVVLSGIAVKLNISATHPSTGVLIEPISLLSISGLHRILEEMVTNFTDFAPLGTVFVSMLGIGLAESSGLIGASLKLLVISAPQRLLTFVIVFSPGCHNLYVCRTSPLGGSGGGLRRCIRRV